MNRRNFFKGLLGAVVAGTALTASQVATAQILGLNKYVEMVRLQKDVIAFNKLARTGERVAHEAMMSPKIDFLLGFAMDNFTGDVSSPEALAATKQIFSGAEFCNTLDEAKLREILEVVIPIAVARNLLAVQRVQFNPHGMVNWNRFSSKYQDLILAA